MRIAQQVQVDEIPLPDAPEIPMFCKYDLTAIIYSMDYLYKFGYLFTNIYFSVSSQIPLPGEMDNPFPSEGLAVPHSILKKTVAFR